MKEYTRQIREEYDKLFSKLRFTNNSKTERRTPEENLRAIDDMERSLLAHWAELSAHTETEAQREWVRKAINLIHDRCEERRKAVNNDN